MNKHYVEQQTEIEQGQIDAMTRLVRATWIGSQLYLFQFAALHKFKPFRIACLCACVQLQSCCLSVYLLFTAFRSTNHLPPPHAQLWLRIPRMNRLWARETVTATRHILNWPRVRWGHSTFLFGTEWMNIKFLFLNTSRVFIVAFFDWRQTVLELSHSCFWKSFAIFVSYCE